MRRDPTICGDFKVLWIMKGLGFLIEMFFLQVGWLHIETDTSVQVGLTQFVKKISYSILLFFVYHIILLIYYFQIICPLFSKLIAIYHKN